jgi:hypothetical protein
MSTSTASLPVTGAGITIAGASLGIQWVAATGAVLVVAGFAAIRWAGRARR